MSLKELQGAKEVVEAYYILKGLQKPGWEKQKKPRGRPRKKTMKKTPAINPKQLEEGTRKSERIRKGKRQWDPGEGRTRDIRQD